MRTPGDIRGCVVLATCREVMDSRGVQPDVGAPADDDNFSGDVDGDMQITLDALSALGIDARARAWDDETVDWTQPAAVVVRSTWDYHRRPEEFVRWVEHVAQSTRLENRADVLAWNIDKRYLVDLDHAGLPVIDTVFIDASSGGPDDPLTIARLEALGQGRDLVVKPAVSAGSNDTRRHDSRDSAKRHVQELRAQGRTVMVQPYLDRVDTDSETGLVYLDGSYSHAFSKGPMLADPGRSVGDLYLAEKIDARRPTDAQRDLGDRVMAWLEKRWGRLLYARIDMLPTDDGPVVIEIELTEPSLYLHLDTGAAARFAEAIARRIS